MSPGLFSSVPLVAVSRVLEAVLAAAPRLESTAVPVQHAEGLVLADALVARVGVPPQAVALRPGWAVEARTTAGAGPYSPILSPSAPPFMQPGALLPPGADAVLPPEAVTRSGPWVEVGEAIAPGEGVRRAGEEAAAGAELCPAGVRLSALRVAAAREAGLEECRVRRPRVVVVAGPDDPRGAFVGRFAAARGAAASRISADGVAWVAAPSSEATAQLVLTADPDEAGDALRRAEATILGRLAARPGEGTICALAGKMPIIVTGPGMAEAAAAAFLILGPWLDRVTDARARAPHRGRLTRKLASSVGLTEIALVRFAGPDLEPLAVADLTLTALAQADAFLAVPPESEGWPAGAVVEAVEL